MLQFGEQLAIVQVDMLVVSLTWGQSAGKEPGKNEPPVPVRRLEHAIANTDESPV